MKLKITYYSGGSWEGGGMIPVRLQDLSGLAGWIAVFLKEVADLRVNWTAAVSNDGRMLGQEKANLVKEMDEIIAGLILFRCYLTDGNPASITSGDGRSFKYNIQILDNLWTGNGVLNHDEKLESLSFVGMHNDVIPLKIKKLFTDYASAVNDRVIEAQERKILHQEIDGLLGDFFRIERKLLCG